MAMNRRQFLHVSGTSALVASLPSGVRGAGAGASFALHELAQPDLISIVGPDVVREIGLSYRHLVPSEHERPALYAAILAARPWPSRVPWPPSPPLVAIASDYFT